MIALDVDSGTGSRRLDLLSYLDGAAEERTHEDAYAWIKAIRHFRVDGVPFRSRFTVRGDSLWWFAELYLHKEQAILNVLRTLAAFDALVERERPLTVRHVEGGYPGVVAHAAAARKVEYAGPGWSASASWPLERMDARAAALALGSRLSRLRTSPIDAPRARVAAFVHSAFWRSGGVDGSAESYIGPVLRAIETRIPPSDIRYVGIGAAPTSARGAGGISLVARGESLVMPVERYAPSSALTASRGVFRDRHKARRSMWDSAELRAHAVIRGCDCWPLVREQLAGIALLQFPWSARAMDEAAAALAAIDPRSPSLTPRRADGDARSRSNAGGAAFRSRDCSTASSIATGSTTGTRRTSSGRIRRTARIAASLSPRRRCSSTSTPPGTSPLPDAFLPTSSP
jgi:hypothetical protein